MDTLTELTAADMITYEDDGSGHHLCAVRFRSQDLGYMEQLSNGYSGSLFVPLVDFEPYEDMEPIDADTLIEDEAAEILDELNTRYAG